jgi:hypothetical protein
MQYTLEYVMCYKEAFALGVATGLLIALYFSKRQHAQSKK